VIAEQVLELVRRGAGTDAQAEVLVEETVLGLARFANSSIHQNVMDESSTVRLRLHVNGRTATRTTNLVTRDGLRDLVEQTRYAAQLCPPDPGWPGLAPAARLTCSGTMDERAATATPAERACAVRDFVTATGGLTTAGYCRTQYWHRSFANTAGQVADGATTEAALRGIARTATSDGMAEAAGVSLSRVDGAGLGARAAAKARAAVDPVELPPGRYEVVLEPSAVADLLDFLAMYGFNGRSVNQRQSFVEPGVAQFDPAVTVYEDDTRSDRPGLPFDADGTPKRRLELITAGVTRTATHDRRTAAEAGTDSTGNALASAWGPVATSLALAPASGAAAAEVPGPAVDSTVTALVAQVRRGVLVSDHWYTRVLDPKSLVVTGLTRNGIWLIEDGELIRPLRNFRFTQSYPQALAAGQVLGIGTVATTLPVGWGPGCPSAPALRLASWHFSGGASG
jgi:predicted Zn-dependent protease